MPIQRFPEKLFTGGPQSPSVKPSIGLSCLCFAWLKPSLIIGNISAKYFPILFEEAQLEPAWLRRVEFFVLHLHRPVSVLPVESNLEKRKVLHNIYIRSWILFGSHTFLKLRFKKSLEEICRSSFVHLKQMKVLKTFFSFARFASVISINKTGKTTARDCAYRRRRHKFVSEHLTTVLLVCIDDNVNIFLSWMIRRKEQTKRRPTNLKCAR